MLWTTGLPTTLVYTASPPPPRAGELLAFHPSFLSYEAHLPAERTQAQAQARLSRAHGDSSRPGDPEAAQGEGSQAALGVSRQAVQRRHRLSRSRDFDAVYRQGRSVATRFLVLYAFEREDEPGDSRLGLAVPKAVGTAVTRNRIKRQLREAWAARIER